MGANAPLCPRCGYDQSGIVAMWRESCPLGGVCSECGLEFAWRRVLNPRFLGPRWSFEHGERALMGRFLRTSAVALWPWKLARDLRLEDTMRPRRLLVFALVWVGAWAVLLHLTVVGGKLLWPWGRPSGWREWAALVAWPYGEGALFEPVAWAMPFFVLCFLPGLLMIFWMTIFNRTFSRGRVRPSQRMRGLCYFIPSAALSGALFLAIVILAFVGAPYLGFNPGWFTLVAFLAWMGWVGAWWKQFIGRYLRIGRPGLIITILMIPTALGTVAGVMWLDAMLQ